MTITITSKKIKMWTYTSITIRNTRTCLPVILLFIAYAMAISTCRLLTWNVRGVMSSAGSKRELLDTYDIDLAFINEHKLREQQNSFFNSLHSGYAAFTLCYDSVSQSTMCGKGGVAMCNVRQGRCSSQYKKTCRFSVSVLDVQVSDRILGIKIEQKELRAIYAFSVYMPSINYSNIDYNEHLDYLYDNFSEIGTVLFP